MSDATCICHNGWSGYGEWVNRHAIDCNTNELAVMGLHLWGTLAASVLFLLSIKLLHRRYARALTSLHSSRPSSMCSVVVFVVTLMNSDSPSNFAGHSIATSVSFIIYQMVRVSLPESELFRSWPTVIASVFSTALFWIQASAFVRVLVTSSTISMTVRGGGVAAQQQLERLQRVLMIGRVYAVGSGLSQIGVHQSDPIQQAKWAQTYLIVGSLSGLWILLWTAYFSRKITALITSISSGDTRLEIAAKRLNRTANFILLSSVFLLSMIVTAIWPWLLTQGSWIVPLLWSTASWVGCMGVLLFLFNNQHVTNSTSDDTGSDVSVKVAPSSKKPSVCPTPVQADAKAMSQRVLHSYAPSQSGQYPTTPSRHPPPFTPGGLLTTATTTTTSTTTTTINGGARSLFTLRGRPLSSLHDHAFATYTSNVTTGDTNPTNKTLTTNQSSHDMDAVPLSEGSASRMDGELVIAVTTPLADTLKCIATSSSRGASIAATATSGVDGLSIHTCDHTLLPHQPSYGSGEDEPFDVSPNPPAPSAPPMVNMRFDKEQ